MGVRYCTVLGTRESGVGRVGRMFGWTNGMVGLMLGDCIR